MDTKTVLQMNFSTNEGRNFSVRVADPREDLTSEEVQEVMELIQDYEFFTRIQGGRIKDARTIQTVTNDFDIIVTN